MPNKVKQVAVLAGYSRGEVVWLLSITREQAIDLDAHGADSCANLSSDDIQGGGLLDEDDVPVIARWVDVQRAKRALVKEKEGVAILQLRAGGFSEKELAELSGRHRLSLRRRWHATVDEILDRLGGEYQPPLALSHASMCLRCGTRPRARLAAIRRRVKGGWETVQDERQASVCEDCLSPEFQGRVERRKVEGDRAAA